MFISCLFDSIVSPVFFRINFVIVINSLGSVIEEIIATRLFPLGWTRFEYVVLVVSMKFDALTIDSVKVQTGWAYFG
ncbi:hypothetical protein Bca4012_006208 [Brassica carinata]|uniref:Uncharacterized protein n=1 Tax=Brassica carinata TaxID=52824 RepID=A0A8X7RPM3_BRACI|nr:hypothetical protein Bca52824_039563 [Brassica carinata]